MQCAILWLFFFPPQSNYCVDKKLLLVLKIEDVMLQGLEPCIRNEVLK